MAAKRFTVEDRYFFNLRRQERELREFAEHETEWAEHLTRWYRAKKEDMPDDEYRACAFFTNKEYLGKPGSLTLCYETYRKCIAEFPPFEKEFAFDLLRYRYKYYAQVLSKGKYDG